MGSRRDRGSVTAELALGLPSVVLVLAVVLAVGRVAVAQVQCIDAARAGARQAARGESLDRIGAVARGFGPDGARVVVSGHGGDIDVEVSAPVQMPGTGWSVVTVRARATGPVEQP
ncbi:MAG TPA: TadE family type IV pilus minor pilin [Kineosporiaceae bacterium]|nr:TadE family type IV pilus minor pilin [Kineosporiaceae bacterium]